jgi:hypothetical protein
MATFIILIMMDVNNKEISCLYLIILGMVKQLREKMNIPLNHADERILCRYGKTTNVTKEIDEQKKKYKEMLDIDIALITSIYIDPYYESDYVDSLHKANVMNKTKNMFKLMKTEFKYKNESGLVVLSETQLNDGARVHFITMNLLYGGIMSNVNAQIGYLQHKIKLLEKDIKLLEKDKEMLQKDVTIQQLNSDQDISKKKLMIKQSRKKSNKKSDDDDSDSD